MASHINHILCKKWNELREISFIGIKTEDIKSEANFERETKKIIIIIIILLLVECREHTDRDREGERQNLWPGKCEDWLHDRVKVNV